MMAFYASCYSSQELRFIDLLGRLASFRLYLTWPELEPGEGDLNDTSAGKVSLLLPLRPKTVAANDSQLPLLLPFTVTKPVTRR